MLSALNQLVGQGSAPSGAGIQAFGAGIIDPTGAQVDSAGSRMSSITSTIAYTATTSSITFYWDGTNGSDPFTIYRDDGTSDGPHVLGSPYTISGLTAGTKYFFYPFWDEGQRKIYFAAVAGGVGSPPVAYTAQNLLAAQQQILRNRIGCGTLLATTGVTIPTSGTSGGSGGTGGGGGSGGGGGGGLK